MKYNEIIVLRHKNSKTAAKAASMATKYFKDKKIKYSITANPKNISKTYCSELVWYSYWKVGVTYKLNRYTGKTGKISLHLPTIIKQYDYLDAKQ